MKPSSRRRLEREIREIMRTDGDNCSLCRRPLEFNDRTFGGVTRTGDACLVGECCASKLRVTILGGVFLSSDFPIPAARDDHDANSSYSPSVVDEAVEIFRAAGTARETQRKDVAARAGIDPEKTILHTERSEWKEDDASWFAANPTRTHRLRPIIGGEKDSFGSVGNQKIPPFHQFQVVVRQVEPGARVRVPFCRDLSTPIPDDDDILHAVFDAISSGKGGSTISTGDVVRAAGKARPKGRA